MTSEELDQPVGYPDTRVNPEYTDKIYSVALVLVTLNIILSYLNISPVKYLGVPEDIKILLCVNQSYAVDLRRFGYGDSEINIVLQTIFWTNVVGLVIVIARVLGAWFSRKKTIYKRGALFSFLCFFAIGTFLMWTLHFTDERSDFKLSIYSPLIKNILELNILLLCAYYGAAEFLCQIFAFLGGRFAPDDKAAVHDE